MGRHGRHGGGRGRRGRRHDFWRAWREEQRRLWREYGGEPPDSAEEGLPPEPPSPPVLHAWREYFHEEMGEWPERHWAFGGRRFKPWHEGIASFNPFVASILSKGGGLLPVLVMHLLDQSPGYGNEVMDRIAEVTAGQWVPNPGAVYPLMSMLEEQGLVQGEWEDPEKRTIRIYRLTPYGERELARLKTVIQPKLGEAAAVLGALAASLEPTADDGDDASDA